MIAYLDASAIVPQFVKETTSEQVAAFVAGLDTPPAISSLAAGEFASALSRLFRTGILSRDDAVVRLAEFDMWSANRTRSVEIEATDLWRAIQFVRRFELGLRMPDAIHAATCQRHGLRLVTLDTRLGAAATALGLATINPGAA